MHKGNHVGKCTRQLSDHLLVSITLSFITGIVFSSRLHSTGLIAEILHPLLLLLLAAASFLYLRQKYSLLIWLLLLISLCTGFGHYSRATRTPVSLSHITNRINESAEVVLTGTLLEMVTVHGFNSRLLIQADSIRFESSGPMLPTNGKILLRLKGKFPGRYHAGDLLAIRCTVNRPEGVRTPGAFDYGRYLAAQDIRVTGFVRSPALITRIDNPGGEGMALRLRAERIRSRIAGHIDSTLQGDAAAIYRAILLGDRSMLSDSTLESFKGSGTMHVLAISGLHVTVISALLYSCLYLIFGRFEFLLLRCTLSKWIGCLCVPFLVGYSTITGLHAPVARAIIMGSVAIGAIMVNKKKSPLSLIALAALILLLINPLQLFSASFQLSFAAIISIILIIPVIQPILQGTSERQVFVRSPAAKIRRWLFAATLVSVAATCGTAPLLLFHFNRISTVGPAANLVIEPLICLWSLPVGIIAIPFTLFWPEAGSLLFKMGAAGIVLAIRAADLFNSLPFSSIWLPSPPPWLTLFYYASLISVIGHGPSRIKWYTPSLLAFYLAVFLMLAQDRLIKNGPDTFQVSFLDVGQGNTALVEYPGGRRIIIDGGSSSISPPYAGERVIAPFLWRKGLSDVDAVIITHPDADHYNGLEFIVRHFSPKIIWVRDMGGHDRNYRRLIRLAEKKGVHIVVPRDGQTLPLAGTDIRCITNLMPLSGDTEDYGSGQLRNRGIVARADYGDISILFPGDIDTAAEKLMIQKEANLRVDILLSPHHGSATSNSPEFLAAVSPKHLVVSAARYSKGRFPHPGLEQECASQDITLMNTASHGTITVESDGSGYFVFKSGKFDGNPAYPYTKVLLEARGNKERPPELKNLFTPR
jgi:competence protein ComEC